MTTEMQRYGTKKWLGEVVKPLVDERIRERFADAYDGEKLQYQFDAGGKRIRPGLALLVGRLAGLRRETALDIACGAELLHTFSLVHDDIIDQDRYRRSQPAVWSEYGADEAIIIGDLLYTHGLLTVPTPVVERACSTVREMCTGLQMEFDFEQRRDVTVEEHMKMIEYKTGSLLEFCVTAPMELTDASLDVNELQLLGPAFQIRDDLLDFEAGKGREQVGNDVRAGKRTIMAVHADDQRVYDILDKPFEETTEDDVQEVKEIFESEGSFDFATERMESLAGRVDGTIASLPDGEATERLRDLRTFVVDRAV